MQEPLDAEVELGGPLYLRALCENERIFHVEAQIANGAFELAQQLPSPKVQVLANGQWQY